MLLFNAIQKQDLTKLRELLTPEVDISSVDEQLNNVFHQLASQSITPKTLEMFNLLIAHSDRARELLHSKNNFITWPNLYYKATVVTTYENFTEADEKELAVIQSESAPLLARNKLGWQLLRARS